MTIDYEWIGDDASFAACVDDALGVEAFALDTEFHRERTYYAHVALVQIAWPGRLILVDSLAVSLAPLARLLETDAVAVMHAADQDLEVLRRECGTLPRKLFDTQIAAGFAGYSTPSLTSLVHGLLDVDLPKGDRLTDWTRRPLSADQKVYAAADVAYLLEVRDRLVAKLGERAPWAEQECAELLERSTDEPEPETAWWRLKNSRGYRGVSRGVAQEVAAWRERRARSRDLPARFVLPDMGLTAIAQRPPRRIEELQQLRGLGGKGLRPEVASEVMAAVKRGLDLAPDQLRLPPAEEIGRDQRAAVALAAAYIAQLAKEHRIDASLLATRSDIVALLRRDPDARAATGWRAELVSEPVRRLAAGEAALAFDGDGGLVLVERGPEIATTPKR